MIVLLAAVVVVCIGVVVVAVGHGGQIAEFVHDMPPLGLPVRRPIAGTDVALLRLPAGPWGYSFRATDDALRRIAHALTERDTRIAVLEQQVSELRAGHPAPERPADDSGSPWFDRSASFEGRPARPPLSSSIRPSLSRTDEPAAIEAKPAGDEADAKPDDDEPGAGVADTVADLDVPEDDEPEAAVAEKLGEPDEDWVFEDDVEPVVEPLPKTGGFTAVPSPGDRLVASNRARADADATEDTDEHPAEDSLQDTPDEKPDDEAETTGKGDDETADGEPRGEGH